jgi:hypothetical protein
MHLLLAAALLFAVNDGKIVLERIVALNKACMNNINANCRLPDLSENLENCKRTISDRRGKIFRLSLASAHTQQSQKITEDCQHPLLRIPAVLLIRTTPRIPRLY